MENYTHPETGNVISLDQLKVGGFSNAAFVLTPGGTLGDLYTTVDLNRDEFGNVYVDKDGNISRTRRSATGSSVQSSLRPTWRGTMTST